MRANPRYQRLFEATPGWQTQRECAVMSGASLMHCKVQATQRQTLSRSLTIARGSRAKASAVSLPVIHCAQRLSTASRANDDPERGDHFRLPGVCPLLLRSNAAFGPLLGGMDGELSVDQLRERLKGLKELVDEGLFTQEDYDRMKGAYVAAEVISVGRRTGIVSSGTEEQAIKRAFWESVTSARSAGGRETASYDFYQIRSPSSQPETPHGTRAAPTPHNTRAAPTPVPTPSQGPSRAQSRAHSGHSTPVPRALSHGRASQDRPPGLSTLPPLVDNEGGPVAAQQAKDPRQLPGAVALPGMAALQNGRPPHALRPVSSAQSDSTGNDDPAPPTSIDGHQYATPSAPSAPAAPNTQPIASTTDDHPSVSVPTMSVPVPSRQGSAAGTVDRAPPRGTVVNEGNNLAGIGFDQAIAAEYKQLLQRGAYMWMIFKIEDGKAVVMETTGDPGTSWSDLMDHLPQHEPRFVLYDHHFRLGDGCQFNKLVFVVWAPESAPVRLKMLYSAGKDALRRNLPGVTVEMQACDWEDMSLAEVDARVRAITQGG